MDSLIVIVDPTAIGSKDNKGIRHVLTKATHISSGIIAPITSNKLVFYDETVLSLIHGGIPNNKKNAEIEGLGMVSKQDYTVQAGYHNATRLSDYLMKMFNSSFEDRYLLITTVKSLADNPEEYIKQMALKVTEYKEKTTVYDRLTNACPHPLLKILGNVPENKMILHKSIAPQNAAIIIFKELIKNNKKALDEFSAAVEESGLGRSPLELGEIIEKNIKSIANENDGIKPKN